jgi:hypothetical protein
MTLESLGHKDFFQNWELTFFSLDREPIRNDFKFLLCTTSWVMGEFALLGPQRKYGLGRGDDGLFGALSAYYLKNTRMTVEYAIGNCTSASGDWK